MTKFIELFFFSIIKYFFGSARNRTFETYLKITNRYISKFLMKFFVGIFLTSMLIYVAICLAQNIGSALMTIPNGMAIVIAILGFTCIMLVFTLYFVLKPERPTYQEVAQDRNELEDLIAHFLKGFNESVAQAGQKSQQTAASEPTNASGSQL